MTLEVVAVSSGSQTTGVAVCVKRFTSSVVCPLRCKADWE